jgi:hypothetical protein
MEPSPLRSEDLLERRRVTIFDEDYAKSRDSTRRRRLLIVFYTRTSLVKLTKKVTRDTALKTEEYHYSSQSFSWWYECTSLMKSINITSRFIDTMNYALFHLETNTRPLLFHTCYLYFNIRDLKIPLLSVLIYPTSRSSLHELNQTNAR